MSQAKPLVSVVIPTRNAGPEFRVVLEAVFDQVVPFEFEVIVVDSGSTDGTLDICRTFPVLLQTISPQDFGHGTTRNLGCQLAQGKYVLFLVQDARPADSDWMYALVRALEEMPEAAGAYSRHLPRPNADYLSRAIAEYWSRRHPERMVQTLGSEAEFAALSLEEKQERCTFNNVSGMIRRTVWEKHPLPNIPYAEDLAWAHAVMQDGWHILYEPQSRVFHSHSRSPAYELRRAYVDGLIVPNIFGEQRPVMSVGQAMSLLRHWLQECITAYFDLALRGRMSSVTPNEISAYLDIKGWYRTRFSPEAAWQMLGLQSPHPESVRKDLWRRIGYLEWLHPCLTMRRLVTGHGLRQRAMTDRGRTLSRKDAHFIFWATWNVGKDYIKRAVLDAMRPEQRQEPETTVFEIGQYAGGLIRGAMEEGVLNRALFWRIRLYAASHVIGKRLGWGAYACGVNGRLWRALNYVLGGGV
ncbi:MAG: glycosyltransferase family 2 protein [Chloroflexi bacterium]|nr:glycosyltransferase family 2 protein [Chloroflexota bacterium]